MIFRLKNLFKSFKLLYTLLFFMVSIKLTRQQEDYINAIYELQDTFGIAKIVLLSKILKYSPGAINDELKRLEGKGYIERIPYSGLRLTSIGFEAAKITVKKHRISEAFLFKILDVPWEKCHLLSSEIEHSISGELEMYFMKKIGEKGTCPHGNSFNIEEDKDDIRALDAEPNKNYLVKRISYEESTTLMLMKIYGIMPGKKIKIISKTMDTVTIENENGIFPLEGIFALSVRLNE